MNELTACEFELVAIGAALGANCASCVDHHVVAARKAGLSDAQIRAAIAAADDIRKVPARKALDVAQQALNGAAATRSTGEPCCAGSMANACAGR